MSPILVKSGRPEHQRIRGCIADYAARHIACPGAFVFERTLDPALLVEGLGKALHAVPIFAGGVRRDKDGVYIVTDDRGARVSTVDLDMTLSDLMSNPISDQGNVLVDQISPQAVHRGAPALSVKINSLRGGGTALGLCFHQSLGDMHSFAFFMRAWQDAIAGRAIAEPHPVDDRSAFLDAHMPPKGSDTPGLRRPGVKELLRLGPYMATTARRTRSFTVFFSDDEIMAMKSAYRGESQFLSANDVVCAHMAHVISSFDPGHDIRSLAMMVHHRPRTGLPDRLLGNMVSALNVEFSKADSASSLANKIRQGIGSFLEDHMDYAATRAFVDSLGGLSKASRCIPSWLNPLQGNLMFSELSSLGLVDLDLGEGSPLLFSGSGPSPLPWLGAVIQGLRGKGRCVGVVVPETLYEALHTDRARAALHPFRAGGDTQAEEVNQYAWVH